MRDQRKFPVLFVLPVFFLVLLLSQPAQAQDQSSAPKDPLRSIRHLANQIYKSAQDMVSHGSEGHMGEIIEYGTKVIERSEILLEAIETSKASVLKKKKKKLIASIRGTRDMAQKAITFSEEKKLRLAIAASRKTSFRAKQTRQRLQMLR